MSCSLVIDPVYRSPFYRETHLFGIRSALFLEHAYSRCFLYAGCVYCSRLTPPPQLPPTPPIIPYHRIKPSAPFTVNLSSWTLVVYGTASDPMTGSSEHRPTSLGTRLRGSGGSLSSHSGRTATKGSRNVAHSGYFLSSIFAGGATSVADTARFLVYCGPLAVYLLST